MNSLPDPGAFGSSIAPVLACCPGCLQIAAITCDSNHGVLVEIVKMTGCTGRSRAEENFFVQSSEDFSKPLLRTSLLLPLLGKRRCLTLPLEFVHFFDLSMPWFPLADMVGPRRPVIVFSQARSTRTLGALLLLGVVFTLLPLEAWRSQSTLLVSLVSQLIPGISCWLGWL